MVSFSSNRIKSIRPLDLGGRGLHVFVENVFTDLVRVNDCLIYSR